MDIKVVLLDMDGTVLGKDQVVVSERNMRAIRAVIEKGVLVVPCTGRVLDMLPPQIEALEGIRYCITSHGANVSDLQTGESIYTDLLTPEDSAQICRIFEEQGVYAEIAAHGTIYIEKSVNDAWQEQPVPPHHIWYMEAGRQKAIEKPSAFFINQRIGLEKVNMYGIPEEKQKAIYDQVSATGLIGHTRPGCGKDLEFLSATLDKSVALNALLKKLDISLAEVMIIGDSSSDVDIIRKAGLGIAMGNAPEWIQKDADDVTAANVDDGVALALEKHLL